MLYHKWFSIVCILGTCLCARMSAQETLKQSPSKTLIIVGAGTGGTAAAIQAARMGVKVYLFSESPWLGGMLTAAGVSAIDGNHQLPSGLWGEFRNKLYAHYGGPEALATGWVSNTHFEPKVGDSILKSMVQYPNLKIYYNTKINRILQTHKGWKISYVSKDKLAHIAEPITLSIIGCVVNGPGEARETDIGLTGGGNGKHMVYLRGVTDHHVSDDGMLDHIVKLVEEKAAEIEAGTVASMDSLHGKAA